MSGKLKEKKKLQKSSIEIQYGQHYGRIVYYPIEKKVSVEFPDDQEVADLISQFLNTEREFLFPKRTNLDMDETITTKPVEHPTYMAYALRELWSHTGVLVHWDSEKVVLGGGLQ